MEYDLKCHKSINNALGDPDVVSKAVNEERIREYIEDGDIHDALLYCCEIIYNNLQALDKTFIKDFITKYGNQILYNSQYYYYKLSDKYLGILFLIYRVTDKIDNIKSEPNTCKALLYDSINYPCGYADSDEQKAFYGMTKSEAEQIVNDVVDNFTLTQVFNYIKQKHLLKQNVEENKILESLLEILNECDLIEHSHCEIDFNFYQNHCLY